VNDAPRQSALDRYAVPGLQRGLEILRLFNRRRTAIGAPEFAKELAIPRSTTFRLLTTLEHLGFLERARNGRDYRLGVAVLTLGFEYLASLEVTEHARPILERLREDTGFTAHLVIRDGREVVFVLKVVAPSTLVSSVTVGTRLPAHATALGRVFLADLSEREVRALYPEARLEQFSAQTPKTVEELIRLARRDRAQGHAISESFFERGISAIAAPVREVTGRVVAAINITIPEGAVERERLHGPLACRVVAAAEELSRRLDYHPAPARAANLGGGGA
jgi:DNA-binding IclR family transcriptional regulator